MAPSLALVFAFGSQSTGLLPAGSRLWTRLCQQQECRCPEPPRLSKKKCEALCLVSKTCSEYLCVHSVATRSHASQFMPRGIGRRRFALLQLPQFFQFKQLNGSKWSICWFVLLFSWVFKCFSPQVSTSGSWTRTYHGLKAGATRLSRNPPNSFTRPAQISFETDGEFASFDSFATWCGCRSDQWYFFAAAAVDVV